MTGRRDSNHADADDGVRSDGGRAPPLEDAIVHEWEPFDYPAPFTLRRDIETGLFACGEHVPICLDGLLCPYCHMAFMHATIDRNETRRMDRVVCCLTCTADALGGCGLVLWFVTFHLRVHANSRMGIRETTGAAACKTLCCLCCAACQTHREMDRYGFFTGGVCYSAPAITPPPVMFMAFRQQLPQPGGEGVLGLPVPRSPAEREPEFRAAPADMIATHDPHAPYGTAEYDVAA